MKVMPYCDRQRKVTTAVLGLACFFLMMTAARGAEPLSIAIIDHQDPWTETKGLGESLADIRQSHTDLTAGLLAGGAVKLDGFQVLIIGSLCTENSAIHEALEKAGPHLRSFVAGGGVVIIFTQADQNRANEGWLEPPAVARRGDSDFAAVQRVQTAHPIFTSPEALSDADLSGWSYNKGWASSWESFEVFEQVAVLAGNHATAPTLGTIIEAGWGRGRVLLLAMAPDKARQVGNEQAKTQATRLMRNLLQYALDVRDGRSGPVAVRTSGGYAGPIKGCVFHDKNANGAREADEPGIAGVGVSDTLDLVLTAADGTYTLPNSGDKATLIYISIPTGWAKTAEWYRAVQADSGSGAFDFALTPSDEAAPFDFVQISDIHVGASGNRQLYTEAIARICDLTKPPAFLIATGDLTNTGSNTSEYDDYVAAIATSTLPLFNVFGNHDANNRGSGNYRRYLGPDYYSFSYGNCHFLIVNSVQKTPEQAAWVAADLAQLRGDKRLFIFQHYSPSADEHSDFATYNTQAVFTGHWHCQHSVSIGSMRSYNSPTLLFGGIDCSPASFKVISVGPREIATRTRYLADGKRLQIVNPGADLLIPRADIPVVVNVYETSADITGVTYEVRREGQTIAQGELTRVGDWSWTGKLSEVSLSAGTYTLEVAATNDKRETNKASASFTVLNRHAGRPTPAGDWPQFGGGPKRGGLVAHATLAPPLGIAWMTHTGGTLDFASPVLYQDTVFVGVKDRGDFGHNGVLVLDAHDGSRKWFAWTPAAISHSVAVDGDQVYAASHGGLLHFLKQSTGEELQQRTLGSAYQRFLYGSPVVFGNRVYAGTYAYFAAFDTDTKTEQWSQSYGADWIGGNAAPATDGTTVVVPANWAKNSLRGVSAATGETIWESSTRGLHGSPVIAGETVVFTTYDGKINAVSLADGKERWSVGVDGPSATTPAVKGDVVVAGGTGSVKAFQLEDGKVLWTFPISTSPLKMSPYNNTYASLVGSPTIVGDTVYVPSGDGRLYVLNLADGKLAWSMNFGTPILSAPCISGNALYLTTYDGHVYALTDASGFGGQ